MEKQEILRDYMLRGGAENKAFISDKDEVYIVKGLRLLGNSLDLAVIDADLITSDEPRKRIGLLLSGSHTHLYDKKATLSDIKKARFG